MFINGAYAPVIGNVCMDMTMLDITDIPDVIPGDVVEVFGNHVTIQSLAADSGTIAYEIMTGINQRVKRMYFEE
jgi:alanine racemase